jgi:hypothetical protein
LNQDEFESLLLERRDDPIPRLEFKPCIERLIDSRSCEAWQEAVHKDGARWEKLPALDSTGARVPEERGLYMFVWRPSFKFRFDPGPDQQLSWILYIGKAGILDGRSDTLRNRYLSEYRKFISGDAGVLWDEKHPTGREARLAKYLTLKPLEYWFLSMSDSERICRLERRLIKMFSPPLNDRHAGIPKIRPRETSPAF